MPTSLSVTSTPSGIGDFGLGDTMREMETQVKKTNAATDADRAQVETLRQQNLKDISDLETQVKFIPPPQLASDTSDRDPNKMWAEGKADLNAGFAAKDYHKMSLAAVAMLAFGAISGGGLGALSGLAGVLKGFVKGRDDRNEIALQKWKTDADAIAKHNQALNDHYTEILNNQQLTFQQRLGLVNAAAGVNGDALMQKITLDKNGGSMAMNLIAARGRAAEAILRASGPQVAQKIYSDIQAKYQKAIKDDDDTIKKYQDQNDTITKVIESQGSITMFSDDLIKQGLPQDMKQLKAIQLKNEGLLKQITAKRGNDQYMYDQFQTKQMNETTDNPEVTRQFIGAGAEYGAVAKVGDKFYRFDQLGSHIISEADFNAAQKANVQAASAGAAADAAEASAGGGPGGG